MAITAPAPWKSWCRCSAPIQRTGPGRGSSGRHRQRLASHSRAGWWGELGMGTEWCQRRSAWGRRSWAVGPGCRCSAGARDPGGHRDGIGISAAVDGDPVEVQGGRGDVGVGAAGAVATGGDAVVVDPEGQVGVGPAVGGAGDP